MIRRAMAKVFYGVAGVVLIALAGWGEISNTSMLSPMARMVFGFLGLALFVEAFQPPRRGEND